MKKTGTIARGFRLWEENWKRLEYAQSIGLNSTEIVNMLLQEHLKPYLEQVREKQARKLREVLNAPVP